MDRDKRTPIIIKKKNLSVLKRNCLSSDMALFQRMRNANSVLVKEDIIYKSKPGDFLKGKYPELTIVNRLNLFANSSRTTAKYRSETSENIERTSDEVTKVIGQKNYDTLFAALCSVISQEYRIQGILALLTVQKTTRNNSCQTDSTNPDRIIELSSFSCQTDETCFDLIQRQKRKKVRKQHQAPYVIQDFNTNIKKLVIKPKHFKDTRKLIDAEEKLLKETKCKKNRKSSVDNLESKDIGKILNEKSITPCSLNLKQKNNVQSNIQKIASKESGEDGKKVSGNETSFPDLRQFVDEDSNISDISSGNISLNSLGIPNLVDNPIDILINIDKHTKESVNSPGSSLTMLDGTQLNIQGKTEDCFHIATAETLKQLSPNQRAKVIWHQAYIDWKMCLERDEDDNLPIHLAALNNDVDLLRRQCAVLKSRQESVDIPVHGRVTALQIAISKDHPSCTAVLLQYGANPLVEDDEQRTAVHLAAETSPDHLRAIINSCRNNARHILEVNDCWNQELEAMTSEEVSKYLLLKVYRMYDNQGYTPLMLASKLGKYDNVQLLVESDPSTVNLPMPSCGNTALYEAVAAASIDAENRGNKSEVADKYLKTVEILIKLGADPTIENNSGHTVNQLLNELNINELSMMVANTIVSLKYSFEDAGLKKDFKSIMLVRQQDGDVTIKQLNNEKPIKPQGNQKTTPKIVEKTSARSKTTSSKVKPSVVPEKHKIITNQESKVAQLGGGKIKKIKNIVIIPVSSGTGVNKVISLDKSITNKIIQTKPIIPMAKVVKVSKIGLNNAVNVINVTGSNVKGNNVISFSNQALTKRITKPDESTSPALPIKKQKRDIQ